MSKLEENLLLEECIPRRYSLPDTVPYEVSALFLALHSDVGSQVVDTLIKRGSMKAKEMRRALSVSPQVLSYHLKKLVDLGVIRRESSCYSMDVDIVEVQEKMAAINERLVANLLLKARMQGVPMEMRHEGQTYIISVKGSEELVMEISEVPFPEILG